MHFPLVKGSLTTIKRAPCNRTLREIACLPFGKKSGNSVESQLEQKGCLPFVRTNRLGRPMNNDKKFFQNQQAKQTRWGLPFAIQLPVIIVG